MQTAPAQTSIAQPTLSTERLTLSPFCIADGKEVRRIAGDSRIAKTTLSVPHPYPDGAAEQWIATHTQSFADGEGVTFSINLKTRLPAIISKNPKNNSTALAALQD